MAGCGLVLGAGDATFFLMAYIVMAYIVMAGCGLILGAGDAAFGFLWLEHDEL